MSPSTPSPHNEEKFMDQIHSRIRISWVNRSRISEMARLDAANLPEDEIYTKQTISKFLQGPTKIGHMICFNDEIIGYGLIDYHADSVHLKRYLIDFHYRRLGIGTLYLEYLKQKLHCDKTLKKIVVLADEKDLNSHLWLRHNRFIANNIVKLFSETYYQFVYVTG